MVGSFVNNRLVNNMADDNTGKPPAIAPAWGKGEARNALARALFFDRLSRLSHCT